MSKRKDADLLLDIKECINRITIYTKGFSYKDFQQDFKTQDAVIRNIEILGEATKLLSKDLKESYSEVPWKSIAGTRDKLIHEYFGVNIDIVWNIAKEEVPKLAETIWEII